jgi:hypothetical protein
MSSIPEQNRQKITELVPEAQWAAEQWLTECEKRNLKFRITSSYRSQKEQDELYAQGRRGIKGEKIVTYTKNSNHTRRIAVDVYPLNCWYDDIEKVALLYGITHPYETKPLVDLPHFEFDKAMQRPQPIPTPEARLKGLERRLKTAVGETRDMVLRLIKRLKQRIS